MSEEDSFVILGSSPLPSLVSDGLDQEPVKQEESEQKKESLAEQMNLDVISLKTETPTSSPSTSQIQCNGAASPLPGTGPGSLAASFLLGEVNADVLKNSVYSQFPSLCSMQACAEDVVKLQNMLNDYKNLKETLDKVNHTMEGYYKITQQWRINAAEKEQKYENDLQQCRCQIEKLSQENQQLKMDIEAHLEQIRVVEDIRQKEHDELRQDVSEKSSLINNMRVEIDKLSQQQLHSYEFVPTAGSEETKPPAVDFIKREEHERATKDLERRMSKLLAENLEIKDMRKTYIDEIDCLKVTLTSAQELLNKHRADIALLNAKDVQKQEEITHLQTQIEIYRRDFEMERADREKNAGEKEQYLLDLRALQRRNQELIEALAEAHKGMKSTPSPGTSRVSLREEQRPVRVLDPTGAAAKTAESSLRCPICSKPFNALSVLQSHVNDCLDKS